MDVYNLNQAVSVHLRKMSLSDIFTYHLTKLFFTKIFFWKINKKELNNVYFCNTFFADKNDKNYYITKEQLEKIDDGKYTIDESNPFIVYRSACITIHFANEDVTLTKYFKTNEEMYEYFESEINLNLKNKLIIT